jgi:hypothetical protein
LAILLQEIPSLSQAALDEELHQMASLATLACLTVSTPGIAHMIPHDK